MWRRGTRAFLMGVAIVGCGGAPTAVQAPVVPVEALPVLTTLTVVLPDTVTVGQTLSAAVSAIDDRARPMTVGQVAWASSNPASIRLTADGTVLALTPGTATISAIVGQVTGVRRITVVPRPSGSAEVASVGVAPGTVLLDIGASRTLTAVLRDLAGSVLADRVVVWSSVDEAIAVVTASGEITARSTGVTTIEARSGAAVGAMQVTVLPPLDSNFIVTVAVPSVGVAIADTATIIVTARSSARVDSVVAVIGALLIPLVYGPIPNSRTGSSAWLGFANVSSLPLGPQTLVATATDALGQRGVAVVPFIHDPTKAGGGTKAPIGSK